MDMWSIFLGIIIGVIATFFMVEIGMRKIFPWQKTSRLTTIWALNEITGEKPLLIVSERISPNVDIPENARIVVKNREGIGLLKTKYVTVNPEVKSNFVVGTDRALIFSGGIEKGAFVIWTTDDKIITRLSSEFNRLWREGK